MNCGVCDKQKNDLKMKTSAILPKNTFLICNDCDGKGLEPRWIVAIASRANVPAAKEFVVNHKYIGEPITHKEVIG